MKNIIITIIYIILYLPINVLASPELSFESIVIQQGKESTLSIKISGNKFNYAGINTTIVLPSELNIIEINPGSLLAGFSIDYRIYPNENKATILAYSENKTFSPSGTIFVMKIKAQENASPGHHTIKFESANSNNLINSKAALSNSDGSNSIIPILQNGNITISTADDTDWDGLPDKWEKLIIDSNQNDLIKTVNDVNPGDDFDGDGYSNLDEYKGQTDPTDPSDTPSQKDDHGDDCKTATMMSLNSTSEGIINKKGDFDYFKVEVNSRSALNIYTSGKFDSSGTLYNSSCENMEIDDNSGDNDNFKIVRSVSGGTFYISVKHSDESKTGEYTLHVESIPDDHGNSCLSATEIDLNSSIAGNIEGGRDNDYFKIQAPYDGKLSIYTTGETDTKGLFKSSNCSTIASNDDYQGNLNFRIDREITKGTYYIALSHYSTKGIGKYTFHANLLQNDKGIICGPGEPSIEITSYPPYNNRIRNVVGKVCHVNPILYKVAVYIYIDDYKLSGYWIKPNNFYPITDINQEGEWICDVTTAPYDWIATEIQAFLIPIDYKPPMENNMQSLPSSLFENAVDNVKIVRMTSPY